MPIRPLLPQTHAFGPDDIVVLSSAFEDALRSLRLIDRNDPAVTTVARHIIELAKEGERDPMRLREGALKLLLAEAA